MTSPGNVRAIFSALRQSNPHPVTELEFTTVFELLVAVVLSAQATDRSVNKATRGLFLQANTPQAILNLGVEGVIAHIRSIGLFRTKARNVVETSRRLIQDYAGQVPRSREALERLPGVGRKTANVVLNVAFGEPTLAVDTHVFRLARRLGLSEGATPLAVEQDLLRCVPPDALLDAHHWMILHGRHICQAKQPRCSSCALAEFCPTRSNDR